MYITQNWMWIKSILFLGMTSNSRSSYRIIIWIGVNVIISCIRENWKCILRYYYKWPFDLIFKVQFCVVIRSPWQFRNKFQCCSFSHVLILYAIQIFGNANSSLVTKIDSSIGNEFKFNLFDSKHFGNWCQHETA